MPIDEYARSGPPGESLEREASIGLRPRPAPGPATAPAAKPEPAEPAASPASTTVVTVGAPDGGTHEHGEPRKGWGNRPMR